MREFFKGWRRKAGVILLVMACVVTAVWIRSSIVVDFMHFEIGDRFYVVVSRRGVLAWDFGEYGIDDQRAGFGWRTHEAPLDIGNNVVFSRSVMYWTPAIVLTLLSAYLILWKPRKRTEQDHA